MKITYIYHSGFAIELNTCVLLFDYYKGELPLWDKGKKIYIFTSHKHQDHFQLKIFDLVKKYPKVHFFIGSDIKMNEKYLERNRIDPSVLGQITKVEKNKSISLEGLEIRSLRSTDAGVAFIVCAEGYRFYHAGDLNWWHWEGEDKAWNHNMAANYRNEVDRLKGQHFHAAFVPIDPRLSEAYYWGIRYFLEQTDAEHVFPMHFWGKYELCTKLAGQPEMAGLLSHYHPIGYQGQEWNLC